MSELTGRLLLGSVSCISAVESLRQLLSIIDVFKSTLIAAVMMLLFHRGVVIAIDWLM